MVEPIIACARVFTPFSHAKVKCSYPLDDSQLTTGHFPAEDWATLKKSLWAPWCWYWVTGANVLVEADGAMKTIVATPDAGVLDTGTQSLFYASGMQPKP